MEKNERIRVVRCPICKRITRWDGNPYRPFCSERCKLIDMANWLDEVYTIEGGEVEENDKDKE